MNEKEYLKDKVIDELVNNFKENENDFRAYVLMEAAYEKAINKKADNIYPNDWYMIYNYKDKIKIIAESLEKNIPINQTNAYKEHKVKSRHM